MKGKIKSIVDEYAASVIKSVMDEYRMGEKDFRHSKLLKPVKARATAIRRLSEAGISEMNISRIMQIDPTTVAYWKRPKDRARRLASRAKYRVAASEISP